MHAFTDDESAVLFLASIVSMETYVASIVAMESCVSA